MDVHTSSPAVRGDIMAFILCTELRIIYGWTQHIFLKMSQIIRTCETDNDSKRTNYLNQVQPTNKTLSFSCKSIM